MTERAAGQRLDRAIRAATLRRPGLTVTGLARAAAIQRDTVYKWFEGNTAPRTAELARVADVLDVPLAELLNAYQGREPPALAPTLSPELLDAIEERVRRGFRDELEAVWQRALASREGGHA
jgi:transcriptional regulator with XRE-family HTH domain